MNLYEEGMFWAAAVELATTMKDKIERTTNLRWGMEAYSKSGCWELTTGTRPNRFVERVAVYLTGRKDRPFNTVRRGSFQ